MSADSRLFKTNKRKHAADEKQTLTQQLPSGHNMMNLELNNIWIWEGKQLFTEISTNPLE